MEIKTGQANMNSNLSIIMYHYVRDLENSRYPNIKGLDFKFFINQIEYLVKYYNVVTAEEVIHSIESGDSLPPKAALLTFDDGYIDHFTNVFPVLGNYNIQGSFYIPVKAIKEHTVLDVNKIHFILASTTTSEIIKYLKSLIINYSAEYEIQPFDYYYKKLAVANRYDNEEIIFIKRLLQVELVEELRNKIADDLFLQFVGIPEYLFAKDLYMSKEQLIQMRNSGMHIGSHGYDHYWWNQIEEEDLIQDIDKSLVFLNEIGVDMDNWTACYPYGSFSANAARILDGRGCKMAVTTRVNIAQLDKELRLFLPRLDTNDLPTEMNGATNEWYNKA
jgi:peptidoglycan/xylan/chitin deacetylase (PgdA/CDA1 family)